MRSKLCAWNTTNFMYTHKTPTIIAKMQIQIFEESRVFFLSSVNFVMVSKRLLFLDRKSNEYYFQCPFLV